MGSIGILWAMARLSVFVPLSTVDLSGWPGFQMLRPHLWDEFALPKAGLGMQDPSAAADHALRASKSATFATVLHKRHGKHMEKHHPKFSTSTKAYAS